MTIVITSLTTVIVEASRAEVRTNRWFQAQDQGRVSLDRLRREAHCASSVAVVNAEGSLVANGTPGRGARMTVGGYCPSNGLTTNPATTVYVTWCTLASTKKAGTFALYRLSSTSGYQSCSTTARKWADYLTTSDTFCLPSTVATCNGVYRSVSSLPTLSVVLPVNLNGPYSTTSSFRLVDNIALRNSLRS